MSLRSGLSARIAAPQALPSRNTCTRCGRSLTDRATFGLGGSSKCLPCSLRYWPMLRRSTLTSLVVGTILVAINQGTILIRGEFPPDLVWKIPLTYVVPFAVATWSALVNSKE